MKQMNTDQTIAHIIGTIVIILLCGLCLFVMRQCDSLGCEDETMCSPSERIIRCGATWKAQTYGYEYGWTNTASGTQAEMQAICGGDQ